jgi:hypothetical protein
MSKKVLLWILGITILQAACGRGNQAGATPGASPVFKNTPYPGQLAQATRQPGCTVKTRQPTPGPTEQSILPPPGDKDWSRGPSSAYMTLIEYADFQ